MNRFPLVFIPAALAALLALAGCKPDEEGLAQSLNDQGYWELTESDVTLQWKVAGTELEVIISAPTDGWVAVGFDPSSRMKDANIIIGYMDGGSAVLSDEYGDSSTTHEADTNVGGTKDVTALGGSESGGVTELRFRIPLNSGDTNDRPLVDDEVYTVILAYGSSDNTSEKHTKRTSVKVEL